MRPRSATDWRRWWAEGGERELRDVLRREWPPLGGVDAAACAHMAARLATLLGSRASLRALAGELGRIRDELGTDRDAAEDERAAAAIQAWFPADGRIGARRLS